MIRRALVIGLGSIGERHARILEELGFAVSIVSSRHDCAGRPVFSSLAEAQAASPFDYIIVANETARHADTLAQLAASAHTGFVLVEKPLAHATIALPAHRFRGAAVGYNLRFHPVIQALRAAVAGRSAQMANFHVGQHLEAWRPGRDVATTYSASRAAGGGVLRDLSHELDLAIWLFGPWIRVAAIGGRLGTVTVDADDGWGILLSCDRCPVVTMEINSLDRIGRRTITVHADGETVRADLIASTLEVGQMKKQLVIERDEIYAAMHQAVFYGSKDVCTFEQGARVVDLMQAVERATKERRWIERSAA